MLKGPEIKKEPYYKLFYKVIRKKRRAKKKE